MQSQELRKKFFDFFVRHGHTIVPSSSLIPAQDPTLLFTNAGMNQFKDLFLGNEKRAYKRAVSIQKCVRAGGKHNDLDNVGFTQRHLTFFEMMGNFSFGDYFKKEAIRYAWDFLTKEIKFPIEDLYVTIHHSDNESFEIWNKEMGVPAHKIFRLGADNFWQMGDTGPCGPCTEIFVDRTNKFGCGLDNCSPACGCDRFIEVWNNVFMQYNRQADGTDQLLKQTGVDTGMGLERLAMLVQKRESVFDTDLFRPTFDRIEMLTDHRYATATLHIKAAFNVLGDHIRSATFLISDGCAPSNEGRGYVLRKIIRRAALFTQKLTEKNIFPELALVVIDTMKEIYPELEHNRTRIVSVLQSEIEKFAENLIRGKRIVADYMQKKHHEKVISGEQAFILYDTYGFPLEVTELIGTEQGFTVDKAGFEKHMEEQRLRSGKKMKQQEQAFGIPESMQSEFTGYTSLSENSIIVGIVENDGLVSTVSAGADCWVIAQKTPFYVACGGQVDDQGTIVVAKETTPLIGLKKIDHAILMHMIAPKKLVVGDAIIMKVDESRRLQTMKNHTATHLLQAGLQQMFGKQVKQAGSVVTPDYLRFDYTHHAPLKAEEITVLERMVNQKIWDNIPVSVKYCTYKEAVADDVIAFFGEKYNQDKVRAILIEGFSKELCGGTHVRATGDIGLFKIVEDVALAAGQRRIVAYTGAKAIELFQHDFKVVKSLEQELKVTSESVIPSVLQLQEKMKELQKELQKYKKEQLLQRIPQWLERVKQAKGVPFSFLEIADIDSVELRTLSNELQKRAPGFYFMVHKTDNRMTFLATVDQRFVAQVDLQQLQLLLKERYGLMGGGNKTAIQGSGTLSTNLDADILMAVIK